MAGKLTKLSKIKTLSERVISILGCNPSPKTLLGTNTYLVGTGKERVLVDTGESSVDEYQVSLRNVLNETSSTIKFIVVTHFHPDHIGGLSDVRTMLKSNIPAYKMAFPAESSQKQYECLEDNISYVENQHVFSVEGATLKAIYNPGHCDDHMVLWLEEENSLFSADTILGEGTTDFTDLKKYMNSLEHIKQLKPETIYPGHGPVIRRTAEVIDYYIKHRLDREKQVLDLLMVQNHSAASIVQILYKDYPPAIHFAAENVIMLHLLKLKQEGRVSCGEDDPNRKTIWIKNFLSRH